MYGHIEIELINRGILGVDYHDIVPNIASGNDIVINLNHNP